MNYIKAFLLLLFVFNFLTVKAQPGSESLEDKLLNYRKNHPRQVLFVHTDKTIYTNNETIWFAGYIFNTADSLPAATILVTSLVKESTSEIVLQKKFIISIGLSNGSIQLPDTLPAGNYRLLFQTNLFNNAGQPLGVYEIPVELKSARAKNFLTTFQPRSITPTADTVFIDVAVKLPVLTYVKDAVVKYHLKNEKPRQLKLSSNGKGVIAIPVKKMDNKPTRLYTSTIYEKETQEFTVWLPAKEAKEHTTVRFFPEGGDCVENIESKIMWEAKKTGEPVVASFLLKEDGKILDTLTSGWDGIGSFQLRPLPGRKYILQSAKGEEFTIPVKKEGLVIALQEGVVNDTLKVKLTASKKINVRLALYNQYSGFISQLVEVDGKRNLKIPMPNAERGVTTLTVLDDNGSPLAERLFFVHYNKYALLKPELETQWQPRSKVAVVLALKSENNSPQSGLVTVSCVRTNRNSPVNVMDIESYCYVYQYLNDIPKNRNGVRIMDDKQALEQALLVQGWRRFNWEKIADTTKGLLPVSLADTVGLIAIEGSKPIRKPMDMVMMKDSAFAIFNSSATGNFILRHTDFLVSEMRKIIMRPAGKKTEYIGFLITDSLTIKMEEFHKKKDWDELPFHHMAQGTMVQQLGGDEKFKALEEVIIKSSRTLNEGRYAEMVNVCGDYLCINGILNCVNHGPYKAPVKGSSYPTWIGGRTSTVKYEGCSAEEKGEILKIVPDKYVVNVPREFYGMETIIPIQQAPEYMATLYWKPFLLLENGKGEISFYTSDLEGEFILKIQGVTLKGEPIYAEKKITVKKN